jgi:hypothetical protein
MFTVFLWTVILVDLSLEQPLLSVFPGLPAGQQAEERDPKEEPPPVYPELSAIQKEKCKTLLRRFKNKNPKKRRGHEKEMIALGRGVIPYLIEKGSTTHKEQGECIYNCLFALMDHRDIVTLKSCYTSKEARMRLLAVSELAEMKKPILSDFLKKTLKDEESDIRLEAALGLMALSDPSGIGEVILAVAKSKESTPPLRLTRDLPLLKGKVYPSLFGPYVISHKDPEVRIASIQVIVYINDLGLKKALGRALSDPHNLVQAAAVNALRKLINNEEPRKFTTVELIDEVMRWKKTLGR